MRDGFEPDRVENRVNRPGTEMRMELVASNREVWVSRYLAGTLSHADAERFEAYWAQHPELTDDLESSARLASGLADLRAAGDLDYLVQQPWWAGKFRFMALAASLAVFAVGVVSLQMSGGRDATDAAGASSLLPRLTANAALPTGETYSVLRVRSTAPADAVLELPASAQALRLRVLPEADDARTTWRVELRATGADADAHAVAALGSLHAAADGFVEVYVDSRSLQPRRYALTVAPESGTAAASRFVLDVRAGADAR